MIVNTSIRAILKKTAFTLLLLLNLNIVFAKERKWGIDAPLTGSAIQNGQLGFIDPEINLTTNYVTASSSSFIELKVNDFVAPFYWFTCSVKLNIIPILDDGTSGTPYETKLTVESNHFGNFGNFIDLEKHLIQAGVRGAYVSVIAFEVINKQTNTIEGSIPANVVLTYSFEVERYYDISTEVITSSQTYIANENSILYSWNEIPGAEGYELEWTWVDDYPITDFSNPLLPQEIEFSTRDFELNNTRIQTSDNFYSIPLVYDRGYLIYRIRPIGRFLQNIQSKYEGNWNMSSTNNIYVSDWNPCVYQITQEHSPINWQFQASYAEEGKKKEVVSYFDGSLRNRQTVTNVNTAGKTVIGEVIYDEEGRPAIEVLPVPVDHKRLQFYPDFNRNLAGDVYSYQDFAPQVVLNCNLTADGMSPLSGASKYYSINNDVQNTHQDFVPTADNYPFSQTEYSLDNTGRIKKKGGVGLDHKLGSNHEMQYFYSVPSQEELNRLFGVSVGNVAHYKKNIVVDPNLQVSVTYIDPQGRTVATALSAKSPGNLTSLLDESNPLLHSSLTTDLLNKPNQQSVDTDSDNNLKFLSSNYWGTNKDGLRYDSQKVFTQAPADYKFTYRLKENNFVFQCRDANFVYPFIYKLNFEVNTECGDNKVDYSGIILGEHNSLIADDPTTTAIEDGIKLGEYTTTTTLDDPGTADTDESEVVLNPNFYTAKFNDISEPALTFTIPNDKVANYGISKQLAVDQEALEIFANDYIEKGKITGCILEPQPPNVDLSPCFYTCEQCEKYYDGLPFIYDPGNGQETTTYPGLSYPNPDDPTLPLTGQDAYVQSSLDSNLELLELAADPSTINDYNDLKALLIVRYEREWQLIKEECMDPCEQSGIGDANGEISSITCDNSLEMVMTDMLPNGQYGIYPSDVDDEGEVDPTIPDTFDVDDQIDGNPITVYNTDPTQNEIYSLVDGIDRTKTNWRNPHYFNVHEFLPTTLSPNDSAFKHYYTQTGQIDYVDVTWNSETEAFDPPLIATASNPSASNPEQPELVNGLLVVDADNDKYKAEPQLLLNVSDFINAIANKESWSLSLVKYHPEFNYLQYQYKTCSIINTTSNFNLDGVSGNDSVTFNSDGLDSIIGSTDSFQDAFDAGFFSSNTSFYDVDPFFQSVHPFDGFQLQVNSSNNEVSQDPTPNLTPQQALQLKKSVMLQALTEDGSTLITPNVFNDFSVSQPNYPKGYDESELTIAQYVYMTLFCNAPGSTMSSCIIGTVPLQDATLNQIATYIQGNTTILPEDKNRFWQMYAAYYIGLKQRVQSAFINLYAARLGSYNDCIGRNNQQTLSKIYTVIKEYPKVKGIVQGLVDLPQISGDDTLFQANGQYLTTKQKRFIPSDSMHNSGSSAQQVGDELAASVNYQLYTATGECPNVRDLKIYLNGVFYSLPYTLLSTGSLQNPNVNFISQSLLESMTGNYSNLITSITSSPSADEISLVMHQGSIDTTPVALTIQPNSFVGTQSPNGGYGWSTYGTGWQITQITQLNYDNYDQTTHRYHFTAIARITGNQNSITSGEYIYREITVKGETSVSLYCTSNSGDLVNNNPANGTPVLLDGSADANCDKKQRFSNDLKELINHLQASGEVNNASTTLAISGLPPFMVQFMGIEAADVFQWKHILNGSHHEYYIFLNNQQRITLKDNNGFYDLSLSQITSFQINNLITSDPMHQGNYALMISFEDGEDYFGYITGRPMGAVVDILMKGMTLNFSCCSTCGEWDLDGDGIPDDGEFETTGCDICDNRIDSDNDGIPNCVRSPFDPLDLDGDEVENNIDNCPSTFNTNQLDSDSDGLGDVCDPCPNSPILAADTDLDGILDCRDNCPTVSNYYQEDIDGDTLGDACDQSCFDNNTYKENFEEQLKDALNQIVNDSSSLDGAGYSAAMTNLSEVNNLINDFNLSDVFHSLFYSQPDNFDFQLQHYRYRKHDNFVSKIVFLPADQLEQTTKGYVILFSGFPVLPHPIQDYTEIIVNGIQTNSFPNNQSSSVTLKGHYQTGEFFEVVGTIRAYFKNTGYPKNEDFCGFFQQLVFANDTSAFEKVASRVPVNNAASSSIKYACDCIPQIPIAVSCTEMYSLYIALQTPGNSIYLPGLEQYTPDKFCENNLQYITQGYIDYLEAFGITSSEHPYYITLGQFGATVLNYGYNDYNTVINEFHQYTVDLNNNTIEVGTYSDGLGEFTEVRNWAQFANWYLINHPGICPPATMVPHSMEYVEIVSSCITFLISVAETYNAQAYEDYINSKKAAFKKAYLESALNESVENFKMNYDDKEYQYTLYYYDQAGNLMQTVAPEGVDRLVLGDTENEQINQARIGDTENANFPQHNFRTTYRYNSLNQLVWQSTPDGGEIRFAYDLLGRIVASQNSKQRNLANNFDSPFNLGAALKTEQNKIYNPHKDVNYNECYGISGEAISEYGSVQHTVSLDSNDEYSKLSRVIFGLSYDKYTEGSINYGFIHNTDGSFRIKTLDGSFETSHPVANGDILKIEREDGYIRFYHNGQLLYETAEDKKDLKMYVNFYLPRLNTSLINIGISYTRPGRDFSYTRYDNLGRIIESGQFTSKPYLSIDDNGKLIYNSGQTWVGVSVKDDNYPFNVSSSQIEVTKSLYDSYSPFVTNDHQLTGTSTSNTRNRVTAILTYDVCSPQWPIEKYDTAIFYNYDIHGNVSEMTQRISPSIVNAPQYPSGIFKKVNYEYDLISGNVNKVYYQKGDKTDQFIHKYNYDADNRITSVETTRDGQIWEKDATYLYYDHGPLAKVIVGDKQVQGIDYAYTLHGWIKTVNAENMATNTKDMGRDGNYISKDAFGYSLTYFNNDYHARNPGSNQANWISNNVAPELQVSDASGLHNGNIKRMITSVRGLDEEILPTQVNLYSYDQLNRIFDMTTFKGSEQGGSFNPNSSYWSSYTYDKNGNLKTLNRDAPRLENPENPNSEYIEKMDRFTYNYTPGTNQLTHIRDEIDTGLFSNDIDDQPVDNYQYDQLGQLISDGSENIEKIDWRVDGKVKSIQKYNSEFFINFFYDGLGNRVAKQVTNGRRGTKTTHYTRDAQGNNMAVYQLALNHDFKPEYNLEEHHIYGSSRLGLQDYEIYKAPSDYYRLVGDKRYELSNHLSNVLNVISDRKIVPKEIQLLHFDTFEEDLHWGILTDYGKVFINKERELQVRIDEEHFSGAILKLKFEENQAVMFNFNINKLENFPTSIPINLEIRNPIDKSVIWSSVISAAGASSGSFTSTVTTDYLVTLSANNTLDMPIEFTVDNFYAYTAPPSSTDYVSLFLPDVLNYNDYYPFGSLVPNRFASFDSKGYRYGFNGAEKDDEVKGEGNSLDLGLRHYDPRIGRMMSLDPRAYEYPWQSPYVYHRNSPIWVLDFMGGGDYYSKDGKKLGSDGKTVKGKDGKQVSDNIAYKTDKATVDANTKNGVTDWDKVIANENTTKLAVSNSDLGLFARTIHEESSGAKKESYAIASTVANLSKSNKNTIIENCKDFAYGYDGTTQYDNRKFSLEAAINALTGGVDYSNGATHWDGRDVFVNNSHFRYRKAAYDSRKGIFIPENQIGKVLCLEMVILNFFANKAVRGVPGNPGGSDYWKRVGQVWDHQMTVKSVTDIKGALWKVMEVHGQTIFYSEIPVGAKGETSKNVNLNSVIDKKTATAIDNIKY